MMVIFGDLWGACVVFSRGGVDSFGDDDTTHIFLADFDHRIPDYVLQKRWTTTVKKFYSWG